MEDNLDKFINEMKQSEHEKIVSEYFRDLELKKQHKKVKQLLRGTGRFNKKRLRERQQLLEVMKGYSELRSNQEDSSQ